MSALDWFDEFNRTFSERIEDVGFAAAMVMILVTTADVLGNKLFQHPVFGALDAVMLSQLLAASLSASATLIGGRHVSVEFFVRLLPAPLRKGSAVLVNLLGFLFFALLVWRLGVHGHSLQIDREVSPTARLPLYPFVYGATFGLVPVCLVYLSRLVRSATGRSTP